MPPGCLIERRNAHEAVDAHFGRKQSVGVLAGDGQRHALQARFVARLVVDHLALEAAALHPAEIHAQQHLGPVLRLGAAGARMDGDDGVLPIVLAAEHLLDFAGLHLLIERVERLRELRVDLLARLGPLDEHAEVVALFPERPHQIAILLEPAAALQDFLGFGLVFPEIVGGRTRVQAVQLLLGAGGLKDSSGGRRRVWSDPDSGASTRRLSALGYLTPYVVSTFRWTVSAEPATAARRSRPPTRTRTNRLCGRTSSFLSGIAPLP